MKKPNKKKAWIIVAIVIGGLIAFGLIWQDMHVFKYASKADAQLMDRVMGPVEDWTENGKADIEKAEGSRINQFNSNAEYLHIKYKYFLYDTQAGGVRAELAGTGEMQDENILQWNLIIFSEQQRIKKDWDGYFEGLFEFYGLESYVDLTIHDIREYADALYAGVGEEDYPAFKRETISHYNEVSAYISYMSKTWGSFHYVDVDGEYFRQYIFAHRPDIKEPDDIGNLTADELTGLWREYSAQEDYSTHVDKGLEEQEKFEAFWQGINNNDEKLFYEYIYAHRPDIKDIYDIGNLTADELEGLWREYSAQEGSTP
jgi:hypothetical protein